MLKNLLHHRLSTITSKRLIRIDRITLRIDSEAESQSSSRATNHWLSQPDMLQAGQTLWHTTDAMDHLPLGVSLRAPEQNKWP